jgi:hypothetical protein
MPFPRRQSTAFGTNIRSHHIESTTNPRSSTHTYTNNTNPKTANMPYSETITTQEGRGMGREWRTHVGDMANHTGAVRGGLGLEQPSRQHACHRHRCNVTHHSSTAGGVVGVLLLIQFGMVCFGLRGGRKGNLRGVGLRPKQRGRA